MAERNGEPTAENLETIWSGLAEEEKHFIEYLFLSEKRIVVALFEDKLFSGLMCIFAFRSIMRPTAPVLDARTIRRAYLVRGST